MLSLMLAAAVAAVAAPAPAPEAARFSVRRGAQAPARVVSWFSALERVLDGAAEASRALAAAASSPTAGTAARAFPPAEAAASAYEELSKDSSPRTAIARLKERVIPAGSGRPEGAPLSAEACALLFSLKSESLNRWTQLLVQGALEATAPPGAFPANALLTLEGSSPRELPLLDLSQTPLLRDGRVASPGLWALTLASGGWGDPGMGAVVLSGRRVWMRPWGAEIFADLSVPGSGGMIRVRYRERGGAALDQARFYFFTRALYDLGFSAGVDNGELVASLEGRGLDIGRAGEALAGALDALRFSAGMKPALAVYLQGTTSAEENTRRLDELVRYFSSEGSLPTGKDPGALAAAVSSRREGEAAREALRGRMTKTLLGLGLKPFPADVPVGQKAIDLYYNSPIEAALARGDLRLAGGRPYRVKERDGMLRLAGLAAGAKKGGDPRLDRLSPLLDHLDTLGMAGPWLAQRGQWRVDGRQWLTLYLLRGPDGRIGAASADLGTADAGPKGAPLEGALALLSDLGLIPAEGAAAVPWPWPARTLSPGPGTPFTARVTYDRAKASLGDSVYVTPFVTPADEPALRRALGLLTTSGGDQAAILAGAAGKPAMNLGVAEWTEGSGIRVAEPVFSAPRSTPFGVPVREAAKTRWISLREGEALRLDPARQRIEFLDPDRQQVLVRLEEALKAYDRGADINALALWTAGQLQASGLTPAQKRLLASEIAAELERRLKTGIPPAHLDRIRGVIKANL